MAQHLHVCAYVIKAGDKSRWPARKSQCSLWSHHMPAYPARKCNHPGCNALSRDGSGRCPDHPRKAWVKKEGGVKRITGRTLQTLRANLFRRSPLCVECERQGRVTLATERDHIVPLSQGGLDKDDNVQGLCGPCHEVKSRAESIHGRYMRYGRD